MSNIAQLVDQVFSGIPGTPRPELRDDIYQKQFDACQSLGEMVSDSKLRQILTSDFQVACVGGSCDLTTAAMVGGASLASEHINSLIFDTIPRGKALHPDSLEPIQWVRGGTIAVDKPRRDDFGYIHGTLSSGNIYLRKADGTTPSDATVIFKCSFSPTIDYFNNADPMTLQLESHLVAIWIALVAGQPAQPQAAAS